jgi:hypothetical protein
MRKLIIVVGFILFVVIIWDRMGPGLATLFGDGFEQGKMPACESRVVIGLLKRAIEESPAARVAGLTVADLSDVKLAEGRWDDDKQHCEGIAFTNAGRRKVVFTVEWMKAAKDKIWLQTNIF